MAKAILPQQRGHSPTNQCAAFNEDKARKEAHVCAREGVSAFARAFNLSNNDDVEWMYSSEVHQRFFDLAVEMVALVERGEVFENPSHTQWLLAKAAKRDPAVQNLIRRASRKSRIR